MYLLNGGFNLLRSHVYWKTHMGDLLEVLWGEAHAENDALEAIKICDANIAMGQKTLEEDRKWRESISKIGLDAYAEKIDETQPS